MAAAEDEAKEAVPACVIMPTGPSVPALTTLVSELRRVMAPNTPEKLKQRKRQTSLEDMMHATLPLGVTHFMLLSQRGPRTQLRLLRAPSGPTLTFRVQQYSLTRGVRALQRSPPASAGPAFLHAPLVVINNFGGADAPAPTKLMKVTFQNMFPPVNVQTARLKECTRVVLFHRNADEDTVEVRHFAIRGEPAGLTPAVKNLVRAHGGRAAGAGRRALPNLRDVDDIADFVLDAASRGAASDTEDEASRPVPVPQGLGHKAAAAGDAADEHRKVRLSELGPRLTLQLVRVEKGVCSGDVMFERAGEPRGDDGAKRKAARRRREGAQAPPAPSAAARPRGDKRQRQKAPSGGKKRARTA